MAAVGTAALIAWDVSFAMPSLGFETYLPHDVALSDSRGCVFDAARLAATVESCARSTLEVLDFISVVVTSVVLSRIGMRFASECDSFEQTTVSHPSACKSFSAALPERPYPRISAVL